MVFGRRRITDRAIGFEPAYENRQRTKPREGTRGRAATSQPMGIWGQRAGG